MKSAALFVTSLALTLTSCSAVSPTKSQSRAIQVPMEIVKRTPVLSFRINDFDVRLQLDLGSGTTLTLYPQILDQIETIATGEMHESVGMEGVVMDKLVFEVSKVELNSQFVSSGLA